MKAVCKLLAFLSFIFVIQCQALAINSTTTEELNPCTQNIYEFTVTNAINNYLTVTVNCNTTNNNVYLTTTQLNKTEIYALDGATPSSSDYDFNLICQFSEENWYLTISNTGNGASCDISIYQSFVNVEALVSETPLTVQKAGYDLSNFNTSYDFYSIDLTNGFSNLPIFTNLEIVVTYETSGNNTISQGAVSFGSLPGDDCVTYSNTPTQNVLVLVVDYCTITANGAGSYYVSILPENDNALNYTITYYLKAPSITSLSTSAVGTIPLSTEVLYYSVSGTAGNILNITLLNIVGGDVNISLSYKQLPYFQCVTNDGHPISTNNNVDSHIQLIVDSCTSESGTYYIGVKGALNNPSIPLTFNIYYNSFALPNPDTLNNGDYQSGAISQSYFNHYEFDNGGYSIDDNTLLNIRLFVSTTISQSSETTVTLYLNPNTEAGPNGGCFSSIKECSATNTAGSASCTIQISPCIFNEYDSWFVSVVAGDDIIDNRFVQYSVIAELADPVELAQEIEIIPGVVFNGNYDHYYLPESLFDIGYQVDVVVAVSSGSVFLYGNTGSIAGEVECPACYNNTYQSNSISNTFTYPVTSCKDAEISDDYYFSIQGNTAGQYASYSVSYHVSTSPVSPSTEVDAESVVIGSIPARSSVNYTLSVIDDGSEYMVTLYVLSQNLTSELLLSLYDSEYLNCLSEENLVDSCTINSETGYCTFVIQPCVFPNISNYLVTLSHDKNDVVYFNFEYTVTSVGNSLLVANEPVVAELHQYQYDLYTYEISGANTVIVTVDFFDDGSQNDPIGFLNVSTLALGSGECFPDQPDSVLSCSSSTQCVYIASSCDLPSQTLNFAVYTESNMSPDLPLKYKILAYEESAQVIMPTVTNGPSTITKSIYPGQSVYHSFTGPALSSNSVVTFALSHNDDNGQVVGFVSQNQFSAEACPCFEYMSDTVLSPAQDSTDYVTISYCEQTSSTYTVLVQASGNTLTSYTLAIYSLTSTPKDLTADVPTTGQVSYQGYSYYNFEQDSDLLTIYLSNISSNGQIAIYYSESSSPATQDCATGTHLCPVASTCVFQVPACVTVNTISVFGYMTVTSDPVSYSITVLPTDRIDLDSATPDSPVIVAPPGFTNVTKYSVDNTLVAPIVTLTLNPSSPNFAYGYTVETNDYCAGEEITPEFSDNTFTVDYCQISDGDIFLFITSRTSNQAGENYTISTSAIDAAKSVTNITTSGTSTKTADNGEWNQFTYTWKAPNDGTQSDLVITVTGNGTSYNVINFDNYATTQCHAIRFFGSYTFSSCCLQEGDYYIGVLSTEDANDFTVTVATTTVSSTKDLSLGNSTTETIPDNQIMEFHAVIDTDYDLFVVQVTPSVNAQIGIENLGLASYPTSTCFSSSLYQQNCNAQTVCTAVFYQCTTPIVNDVYIGVSSSGNLTVDVLASTVTATALTIATSKTQDTVIPDFPYLFSVTLDSTQITYLNDLEITVTPTGNATVTVTLFTGCNNQIDTCNSYYNSTCTVSTGNLCQVAVTEFLVMVVVDQEVSFDILADFNTITTTALESGKAAPSDSTAYFTIKVDTPESTQMVSVNIQSDNNTVQAFWGYNAPVFCLDSENVCAGSDGDCTFVLEACQLINGEILVNVVSANNFTITYTLVDVNTTAITLNEIGYYEVDAGDWAFFTLDFDRSAISAGQMMSIDVSTYCGSSSVDYYVNQGTIAGPVCSSLKSTSNSASLTYSTCDLLSPIDGLVDQVPFSITVIGGTESFGVSIPFSILATIVGETVEFVAIAPNQEVVYSGKPNTIYTYSVAGINDFTGELEFTLFMNISDVIAGDVSATVNISPDLPYNQILPCNTQNNLITLSIDSNSPIDVHFESSCSVEAVRTYYISFSADSTNGTTFLVSRTRQYVRDLNEYPTFPQTGAVVASAPSGLSDEEYYEIQVVPSAQNFRLIARVDVGFDQQGGVTLLGDLVSQPSSCAPGSAGVSCQTGTNGYCEVIVDSCQFTNPLNSTFLTVYASTGNSETPLPYNLTVSQNVSVITLPLNTSVCGSMTKVSSEEAVPSTNDYWRFYSYTVPTGTSSSTSITFYEFLVYSISYGSTVNVYLSTNGLATNNCNTQSMPCSSTDNSPCSLFHTCDSSFSGSFSLGVFAQPDTTYYVRVIPHKGSVESLTVTDFDNGDIKTTTGGDDDSNVITVDGETFYMYSFTTPALAATQTLLVSVTSEESVTVTYGSGTASIRCAGVVSGSGTDVTLAVNSCDYTANSLIYVFVEATAEFEIAVGTYSPVSSAIPAANAVSVTNLMPSTTPQLFSYTFDVTQEDIASLVTLEIHTTAVNQPTSTSMWLSFVETTSFTGKECAIATLDANTLNTIDLCNLKVGTYAVNIEFYGNITACTYGSFAFTLSKVLATNVVTKALTSGQTQTVTLSESVETIYTFTPTTGTTPSLVSVATISDVALLAYSMSDCELVSSPVQYYYGCAIPTSLSLFVTPIDYLSPLFNPDTSIDITVTQGNVQQLTTTATTATIATSYVSSQFYYFQVNTIASLEIFVNVEEGPAVDISIMTDECDESTGALVDTFTCYLGYCVVPISQRQGILNNITSHTFYVKIDGVSPSKYTISLHTGEEQTCITPAEGDLSFCSIVEWPVWTYDSTDGNVMASQDDTAERRFNILYEAFCPPCTCVDGLSEECNASLTEYVCTNTFRACDYEGFEASICLTSCDDVQTNCGKTFEEVGFPELSCNHNFYLSEEDPICTDIYGVSGESNTWIWIIVGIVVALIVIALLVIAGVVIYKQVQAKKQSLNYEVIE